MGNKQLGYDDISLIPKKCKVNSRQECDTSVKLGNRVFKMPVIPANMKSVVNPSTCKFLAKQGLFYIMHRFGDYDICQFIKEMYNQELFSSISVGINKDSYGLLNKIKSKELHPEYITIDVANAWSDKCKKMVEYVKTIFPETFLIVGNVATSEAIIEMQGWEIDTIKVGLACGATCITKHKTGVSRNMVSTILDCVNVSKIPLIADGGIVYHGDIAKALAFKSTMVMAGYLFAGYEQSAGNIIEIEDTEYKEYYGNASKYNKEKQKNVEGKKILVKYKGDMTRLLVELKEDLQSSISYVGGKNLDDLRGAEYFILS